MTAMTTQNVVFCYVKPCFLVQAYQIFGGSYCLNHQENRKFLDITSQFEITWH
jgi:hypothetical protein